MVDATEIINEIKEQEDKGLFKGLRKRRMAARDYSPSQKQVIHNIPFHIQNSLKITGEFKVLEKFQQMIIAGTGINAAAGDILKEYLKEYKYPMMINRDFSLPEHVNSKTLVIIASYSGDDEEAILCYRNALRKGCRIIGLSSGGRLLEALKRNNTEHIALPAKLPESTSFTYVFFPILRILENSHLIKSQKEFIDESIKALKKPELREMARQLYERLEDKIPMVYSSRKLSPVARYWKLQLNLTAKVPAFSSVFSDAVIEINAYTKNQWDFYLVFLRDEDEEKEVIKSMSVAKNIIKNKGHGTTEIMIKGTNPLTRIISAVHIADFASYFLSEYYKTEEDLLEKYRAEYKATI